MTGPDTPTQDTALDRLGLGCSHIASLSTRPGSAEITALLDRAYAGGIRFFDTADIYGQGDSEARLARVAGRDGVLICTKAGLQLGVSQVLIRWLKPVLRPLLLRLKPAASAAANARQKSQRTDFDPDRLRRSLTASLRRLNRSETDVFLLHNPSMADLESGTLYDLLDRFRAEGLAGQTGVSCDSLADAEQILASGRVGAIQIPLNAQTLPRADGLLTQAAEADVMVIAREVLPAELRRELGVEDALAPLLRDSRISVVLVGTTSADHLVSNMAAARAVLSKAGI